MEKTETEAGIEREYLMEPIRNLDGRPVAVVPAGTEIKDLEQYLLVPLSKRASVTMNDSASFVRYVNEHKLASTRIFATVTADGGAFNAILDYHEAGAGVPARGQHRVSYALKHSAEWLRWKAKDGVKFSQRDFAKFLEDNIIDVVIPPGGEVLDLVTTLEATATATFKGSVKLQNGDESVSFERSTESKSGANGDFEIPREITLFIPVFEGQEAANVGLRLRHNVGDKCLTFTFEIMRANKIVEARIVAMIAAIAAGTGIEPFRGSVTIG